MADKISLCKLGSQFEFYTEVIVIKKCVCMCVRVQTD